MKRTLASLVSLFVSLTLCTAEDAPDLKVGDEAPAFELKGSDGKTYKSADYKDKKAMVIAWFPKAKTGG